MLATCVAMGSAAESVKLDDDVHEELRKLAESFGRPLAVLANDALRDFLRYERSIATVIDRGLADLDAGFGGGLQRIQSRQDREPLPCSRRPDLGGGILIHLPAWSPSWVGPVVFAKPSEQDPERAALVPVQAEISTPGGAEVRARPGRPARREAPRSSAS
jgi:predicted transcriptional regulator